MILKCENPSESQCPMACEENRGVGGSCYSPRNPNLWSCGTPMGHLSHPIPLGVRILFCTKHSALRKASWRRFSASQSSTPPDGQGRVNWWPWKGLLSPESKKIPPSIDSQWLFGSPRCVWNWIFRSFIFSIQCSRLPIICYLYTYMFHHGDFMRLHHLVVYDESSKRRRNVAVSIGRDEQIYHTNNIQ